MILYFVFKILSSLRMNKDINMSFYVKRLVVFIVFILVIIFIDVLDVIFCYIMNFRLNMVKFFLFFILNYIIICFKILYYSIIL